MTFKDLLTRVKDLEVREQEISEEKRALLSKIYVSFEMNNVDRIQFDGGTRGWVQLHGTFSPELLQRILDIMKEIPAGPERVRFDL